MVIAAYAELGGVAQVIFGGGDGYLYSFAAEGKDGKAELLWKFDCNPKDSLYSLGGAATRNHVIATPVVYDGLVYVAVGEDPEHGEGGGHLWCIDPTKRGDVSPTLVYNSKNPDSQFHTSVFRHSLLKTAILSAIIQTRLRSGTTSVRTLKSLRRRCIARAEPLRLRTTCCSLQTSAVVFHCVDAKTGKAYWTYDMFAASWVLL